MKKALKDAIIEYTAAAQENIEASQEEVQSKIKPTHGSYCTCQECGYPNDWGCQCPRNHILTDIQGELKGIIG